MGASRCTRRRKGIRDRERRLTEKGKFFSENAFLHLQKLQKLRASRVLRVLRVLRALRALRALWFQWFALVFSSRRCFGLSLQLIVLFEKVSKLRGVENAHTWRHMVRLTRRSTSFCQCKNHECVLFNLSFRFVF